MAKRPLLILLTFVLCQHWLGAGSQACPLNCNDLIHVSLASNCMRTITPYDVMNGDTACMDDLIVDIEYYGNSIGNQVGVNHIGKTLKYRVIDPINNNSCWGEILVSKKSKPILSLDTLDIDCLDPVPSITGLKDSCGLTLTAQVISSNYTQLNCNGPGTLVGRINRRLLILDLWNNSTQVDQVINLLQSDLTGINCPSNKWFECCTPVNGKSIWDTKYSTIDNQGYAHPKPILDDNGNSVGLVDPPYKLVDGKKMFLWEFKGKCKIAISYSDHIIKHCGWSYTIKRHWVIEDWCSGDDWSCYQEIDISDNQGPVVEQLSDVTINSSDYDCKAHYTVKRPKIIKECGLEGIGYDAADVHHKIKVHFKIIDHSSRYSYNYKIIKEGYLDFHEEVKVNLPPGSYQVKYEFLDACEKYGYTEHKVTVRDNSGPVANCVHSKKVTMNGGCKERIYAKDMDSGSHHTCCNSVHVAIASMDSINYYKNYWHNHFKDCMSGSQYQSSKYQIDQTIEEWINSFVFNDYVDLQGCGNEEIMFRVYETCEMKSYENWFPGNKHQWYCYQTVKNYDCYFVSHYPYLEQDMYHHAPMKCGTSVSIDYCYNYSSNTFSWLSNQGVNTSKISALRKVEQNVPTVYAKGKYVDCSIDMYKQNNHKPVCNAPGDLTLYCDGTPHKGYLSIEGEMTTFEYAINAKAIECNNPTTSWTGPNTDGYGNYSLINGIDLACDSAQFGLPSLGSDILWKPIYCRAWLLLDDYSQSNEYETYFGEFHFDDPCSAYSTHSSITEDLNDCGNGSIIKTWTLSDHCGNKTTCSQTIEILHRSDFEITFPSDLIFNDRIYNENEDYGFPEVADDDCEKLDINFEDSIDSSNQNSIIIYRYWTVKNTCVEATELGSDIIVDDQLIASEERSCVVRYLKDNGDGYMQYVQLIKFESQPSFEIVCPNNLEWCADSGCSRIVDLDPLVTISGEDNRFIASLNYVVTLEGSDSTIANNQNKLSVTLPIGSHLIVIEGLLDNGSAFDCSLQLTIKSCGGFIVECTDELTFCNNTDCLSDSLDALIGSAVNDCDSEAEFLYQHIVKPFKTDSINDWIIGAGNYIRGRWPVGQHSILLITADDKGQLDTCETDFTIDDCSNMQIQYLGEESYCNAPGKCSSDTLNLAWTVNRNCSSDSSSSLSYLFVIKPFGTEDHSQWILESKKTFTGVLPIGVHTLEMMVIDPSGPSDTMIMEIEITDCEAPQIVCTTPFSVLEIVDSNGISIMTADLIDSIYDNCSVEELLISFANDTSITKLNYSCKDLTGSEDTIHTSIWVTDLQGNTNSCEIELIIRTVPGACSPLNNLAIQSAVMDMMYKQVNLNSTSNVESLQEIPQELTNSRDNLAISKVRPNPFEEFVFIETYQSEDADVRLTIYDLNGQEVYTIEARQLKGKKEWVISGNNFPSSGVYLCHFQSTIGMVVQRISYLK